MEGDRLSALILLPITLTYYALITLLFWHYRHEHPISDRSSKLTLCRAILLTAASTLLLLHLYLPPTAPSSVDRVWLLSLFVGLIPASLLLLMRTIALTMRLELTAATEAENSTGSGGISGGELNSSRASSDDNDTAVRRLSLPSQHNPPHNNITNTLQQPRPSTSMTLDEPALSSDDTDKATTAAAEEAWLLQYRWMVEGSFLTCLFSPLLLLSLVGLLLLSLLPSIDTSSDSSAAIAVYVLGHVILFTHWLLLLYCCVRYQPAWNELRAEAVISVLCAIILPLSLAFSIASQTADTATTTATTYLLTSQYTLLAYYVLTFTSSLLLPLLSSLLPPAYLSQHTPLPLQTFVDLIHTSTGYNSFLSFLRTEFSEENLLFWKDVNALEEKRREWEELEERRRRRDEKEKGEAAAATNIAQPIPPQHPPSTPAGSGGSGGGGGGEGFGLLAGLGVLVNKPLLTLKMSGGLESLSSTSASSTPPNHHGSESPHSRSLSRVALPPTSPKSPSRHARIGSVEVTSSGRRGASNTRNTLQPSGSSAASAARKSGAISPRSASENGRRVVSNELNSSPPDPSQHSDDVFLLPSAKRATSYSNSVSPGRKHSGNGSNARQQPAGLTLHPGSIHPTMLSTQQSSVAAHQRDLSMQSASYILPFPLDDSWDMDAISKLRRISWSIALEKKAAMHRASRSRDSMGSTVTTTATSTGRTPQAGFRAIAESTAAAGGGGERITLGSTSMSPRRLSPPPAVPLGIPLTLSSQPADTATTSSPRLTAAPAVSVATPTSAATHPAIHPVIAPSSPATFQHTINQQSTPHSQQQQQQQQHNTTLLAAPFFPSTPQSPSIKSPFMQSIVRALQATKLTTLKQKDDDERRRDDERRVVLMRELVRGACDVYDKYVVAGSAQQVNLPAAIVQSVMERMKEINRVKYDKPKLHSGMGGSGSGGGHSRHGKSSGGVHGGGMQHTLGLMRHATMHFLAGAGGGGGGAKGGKAGMQSAKVHPLLAAKLAKQEAEAKQQRELEDAGMTSDITLLSYPFAQLFSDAHHAIEQLMEKDSFKRYLQSPAYEQFTIAYDKTQSYARGGGATTRRATNAAASAGVVGLGGMSRRGSRLAVITPRTSKKVGDIAEEGSEGDGSGSVRGGGGGVLGLGGRRLSDSVSLQLHIKASPREQRSSLSLGLTATNSPRTLQPSPATAAARKPLPVNSVRIITPSNNTVSGRLTGSTASPRRVGEANVSGGSPATMASGRRLEVRRGSVTREGDGSIVGGGTGGGSLSIAVL